MNADENLNNQIDLTEFFNAIDLLKKRIAQDAMWELGFTSKTLYSNFFLRFIILFLILVYMVMGLSLFSTPNDFFNVILNAAIPILVGVLLMSIINLDRKKEELSKSKTKF